MIIAPSNQKEWVSITRQFLKCNRKSYLFCHFLHHVGSSELWKNPLSSFWRLPMIDKHTTTWSWKQDHPRICTYSLLILFCRMKCCQIWQPVVTLYKGWSVCQILYKHFTRDGQCAKCANNQTPDRRLMPRCRERGLNRFEFLSKAWNQPAGRQRIKEDTERDGFWLQTFKSEQWGQLNGPALS